MKRVMIIGGSGSGKSTLAVRLGEITGLPVIHIDPMYWKPGWVQRDAAETRALVLEAAVREAWVFEGNNSSSFPKRLARADTLIFLDLSTPLRTWRVLKRSLKFYGQTRPDLAEGCPERFDWAFTKWVIGYRKRGRPAALALVKAAPDHIETIQLKTPRQVKAYLASVARRKD